MDANILVQRTRPAASGDGGRYSRVYSYGAPTASADAYYAYASEGYGAADVTGSCCDPFPEPRGFERSAYAGRRSRKPVKAIAVTAALAFVALVTFCSLAAITLSDAAGGSLGVAGGAGAGGVAPDGSAVSTPKDQWRRGTVPSLYQTDKAWADEPYGDGTMATHGCGPTALSMAYISLTGKTDRDPAAMAGFSTEGGYLDGGVTSWLLMSAGANELGLTSNVLPANAGAVREALLADHPVICSVGPGDFTTDGHFIVLVDANADGTVSLRDPNSPERTAQAWDLERVMGQCLNMWELSR